MRTLTVPASPGAGAAQPHPDVFFDLTQTEQTTVSPSPRTATWKRASSFGISGWGSCVQHHLPSSPLRTQYRRELNADAPLTAAAVALLAVSFGCAATPSAFHAPQLAAVLAVLGSVAVGAWTVPHFTHSLPRLVSWRPRIAEAASVLWALAAVLLDWAEAAEGHAIHSAWTLLLPLPLLAAELDAPPAVHAFITTGSLMWLVIVHIESWLRYGLFSVLWARDPGHSPSTPCDCATPPCPLAPGAAFGGLLRCTGVLVLLHLLPQRRQQRQEQLQDAAYSAFGAVIAALASFNLKDAERHIRDQLCSAADTTGSSTCRVAAAGLEDLLTTLQDCMQYLPDDGIGGMAKPASHRHTRSTTQGPADPSIGGLVAVVTPVEASTRSPHSPGLLPPEWSAAAAEQRPGCSGVTHGTGRSFVSHSFSMNNSANSGSGRSRGGGSSTGTHPLSLVPGRATGMRVSCMGNPLDVDPDETAQLSPRATTAPRTRWASVLIATRGIPDAAGVENGILAEQAELFATAVIETARGFSSLLVSLTANQALLAWNVQKTQTDHASSCCRAALRLAFNLEEARLPQAHGCRCREWWGIGVGSGSVLCGMLGSSLMRRFTVAGDIAASVTQLSELCPYIPVPCLGTESIRDAAGLGFHWRPVDVVPGQPYFRCPVHEAEMISTVVYALQSNPVQSDDWATRVFQELRRRGAENSGASLSGSGHSPAQTDSPQEGPSWEEQDGDTVVNYIHFRQKEVGVLGLTMPGWIRVTELPPTRPVASCQRCGASTGSAGAPAQSGPGTPSARTTTKVPCSPADTLARNLARALSIGSPTMDPAGAPCTPRGESPPLTGSMCGYVYTPGQSDSERRTSVLGSDRMDSDDSSEGECMSFIGIDEDHYDIAASVLGRGAFGTVRLCMHSGGALYAAKMLKLPVDPLRVDRRVISVVKNEDGRVGMRRNGTAVKKVVPGGPAYEAGLRAGMEILMINDITVNQLDDEELDIAQLVRDAPTAFTMVVVDCGDAQRYRTATSTVRDLLAEVQMLSSLRSEYVVGLTTCGLAGQHMVLVMELAAGGSLNVLISSFGRLPVSIVVRYTRGMLRGLQLLHRRRIAHRDFKSANVLLGSDGQTKLTDFGCAQHLGRLRGGSRAVDIVGTPLYLSPEACDGKACEASDIWSLGIVVQEVLTGLLPYTGQGCSDPRSVVTRLALRLLRPLIPPEVPEAARSFLELCFKEMHERPDANALLEHDFLIQRMDPQRIQPPTVPSQESVGSNADVDGDDEFDQEGLPDRARKPGLRVCKVDSDEGPLRLISLPDEDRTAPVERTPIKDGEHVFSINSTPQNTPLIPTFSRPMLDAMREQGQQQPRADAADPADEPGPLSALLMRVGDGVSFARAGDGGSDEGEGGGPLQAEQPAKSSPDELSS